jgi:electron transport complex protein RnfD
MTLSQPKPDNAAGRTLGPLTLSSLPHINCGATPSKFMLGILCALIPAAVMAVITTGAAAAVTIIATIAAAYSTDWILTYLRTKRIPRFDGSAPATGMLLALSCPADLPVWAAPLGAIFAIAIAKQAVGGLGRNFLNPALAGRAFCAISFPQYFTATAGDSAAGHLPISDMLFSLVTGSPAVWTGALSPVAIIAGAAVLWYLRIIDVTLPLAFILSAFALFWSANLTGGITIAPAAALATLTPFLFSGILFGALFMATDPVTSPGIRSGRLLYGIGCGMLMFVFSFWSTQGNALMYAILIMNCTVPLFDAAIVRRPLGNDSRSFRSDIVPQANPLKKGIIP